MRKFKMVLQTPEKCDCCGAALLALPTRTERGSYELTLPEGQEPTEIRLGWGIRLVLGGGRLIVELESNGPSRAWELRPLFNDEAFGQPKRYRSGNWYSYIFTLPEFKPSYSTWWAELKFTEVDPFKRAADGSHVSAPHAATMSIKLETL
jgi:hypothetical protein